MGVTLINNFQTSPFYDSKRIRSCSDQSSVLGLSKKKGVSSHPVCVRTFPGQLVISNTLQLSSAGTGCFQVFQLVSSSQLQEGVLLQARLT